jgi:hypothetical protein
VRLFRVRLSIALLASTITQPIVCFVFPVIVERLYLSARGAFPSFSLSDTPYFVVYGAIAETFAVVVEAILIVRTAKIGRWRALLASIVANSASGLVGLICSWLTGFP